MEKIKTENTAWVVKQARNPDGSACDGDYLAEEPKDTTRLYAHPSLRRAKVFVSRVTAEWEAEIRNRAPRYGVRWDEQRSACWYVVRV